MRKFGIAILGLIAFYVFIHERGSDAAAEVLTSVAAFYVLLTLVLLRD